MKLSNKFAISILSGALALSMVGCSSASPAPGNSVGKLVGSKLAANGSAYSVETVNVATNGMVGLINEAVSTYNNYKNSLINTEKLAQELDDDGESKGSIKNKVNEAKNCNLTTRANFQKSVDSFNARGMNRLYTITAAQVPAGIESENAVADYVVGLIGGDAQVFVSDIIEIPVLDDAEGTYTGGSMYLRYAYVAYPQAK